MVCDLLAHFSRAAEPGFILWKYESEIQDLLSHNHKVVKIYALREILVAATHENLLPLLLKKTNLLVKCTQIVGDNDIGVAQVAMNILKKIGHDPNGIKYLYSGALLRALAKSITTSDVAKFRVYEIVVDVAVNSKAGLEASINSGYLHDLIRTYDTDDILLQLNALQTMSDLASIEGGLEFLEDQGIVRKLADKIATVNDNPLDAMLIPGLMTFFGHVAKLYPQEIISKYPLVINSLSDVFQSNDQLLVRVAVDTFAYVASTLEGKYALQVHKDLVINGLDKISKIIQSWPTQFRVSALNALVLILNLKKTEQNNRSLELTKSWFNLLGDKPLDMIVSLCKQPFVDIRVASLEVLAIIASQSWGQEYMIEHPGLIEFLLDRNIESFKESKEAKFQVVKNLIESRSNLIDAKTMEKFEQFVREGPFYVDVITEVVLEGAS